MSSDRPTLHVQKPPPTEAEILRARLEQTEQMVEALLLIMLQNEGAIKDGEG